MANKPTLDEMRLALTKRPKRMAEKVDLTRLYRGGYNPEPYEAQDIGAYGGLFASGTPEPASSHGPHLHYTDIPTNKILTHYALNYEVPHEKVKQALIKFAPHVKEDKELFDKLHDVVVNDKGQDLRNLDDDEIFNLLRKEPGADADNEAQRLRGQIAKHLGYHAVELEDEHGLSYLTTHGVKFKPYVTKSKGGEVLPHHQREANKAKFLEPSKVKDVLYHGSKEPNIVEFKTRKQIADENYPDDPSNDYRDERNAVFLSPDPKFTRHFSVEGYTDTGQAPTTYPVHVQARNPFDFDKPKHRENLWKTYHDIYYNPESELYAHGPYDTASEKTIAETRMKKRIYESHKDENNWPLFENPNVQQAIQDMGHDSFYIRERGTKNLGVYDPRRIKSAIGNRGTYDTTNPDINKAKGGVVSILRKHGRPVDSDLDAMRKMSNGHRVFIAHEQDEKPREITSVSEMHGYTPDQIYTVDPQHFAQHKAKGGNVMPKYPSIEEMLQKLQESGRTPIMPAPDRWFKKPEQHPFQQKAIEKLLAYTGHNREAFPHGAHINPVTGEPLDFEIMHDLGVAIDPTTGTPRMSGIKSGLTEIDPKLGSLTKSNLIRKGLFKHEGGDPLLDRIKFLATIEKSGKGHHYGLSTHYESPAELVQEMRGNPTLRPHSRGDIYGVGDEVGRISIKGMHHPVFEKLVVAPSGMNVQGKKLHKANGGKVTHAHHLEIEERPL